MAGWINTKGSGHVCLIVPGKETVGNWNYSKIRLPNAMDTGYNMRYKSQALNESFGKKKHSGVVFFKYK